MLAKVCNALTAVIIAVLLGVAALLVGPPLFGNKTVRVLTGSMEPNLPIGSLLIINTKVTVDDLTPGEIITYDAGGMLATHRLMEFDHEQGLMRSKGDNNPGPDGWMETSRLVGRVALSIPKLGGFIESLQSRQGIMIIGTFVVVMIMLIFIPEIFKKDTD